jgi:hypothetical protein
VIDKTIGEVYDEAEKKGLKAPNVKEIVPHVQKSLGAKGYRATGQHIQELASADMHKLRRRKPGPTVAQETRRQQK